jgi:hypothetical protein
VVHSITMDKRDGLASSTGMNICLVFLVSTKRVHSDGHGHAWMHAEREREMTF